MDARPMRRVSVVGVCGSGKTTLARQLAGRLGVRRVEVGAVFHPPHQGELPDDEFRRRLSEALDGDAWVVEGNYSAVRDLVWQEADTVVWLDLPRGLVMRRLTARTLRRVLTREELWNGNREPFSNLYRLDPEYNILRWAWTRHPVYVERYSAAMEDPVYSHLRFIRLRSPGEVEDFLAGT
jgi:adenylate kinase family enzyme